MGEGALPLAFCQMSRTPARIARMPMPRHAGEGVSPEQGASHHPFAELIRHVIDGTSNSGLICQHAHTLAHGTDGTLGGVLVLAREEAVEPLHIEQRLS